MNHQLQERNSFDPTLIRISTQQILIPQLFKKLSPDSLNIIPSSQNANLWTNTVKSRLVESMLVRIPLPVFYLDSTGEEWEIIDGRQRLLTLKQFMIDKTLRLSDLEFMPSLNGLTYDKLERWHQRRIEETELMVHLIEQGTPREIKYSLYQRIKGENF